MSTRIRLSVATVAAILGLAIAFSASAQVPAKVTGTVYDTNKSTPMAGATVLVKGTQTATITDHEGNFSIKASPGDVLSIQFMGYLTEEISVTQAKKYSAVLKQDPELLEEVVVTALGLKREKRSLGYAATDVSGDALSAVQNSNWVAGLQGKVAGLNFNNSGSSPISSQRVIVRGETLLSGNSSALFVVDGIPITSGSISNSSGNAYGSDDAPIDYGDGVSDLNPDDIESITVLKGAAATALYGSRAGNGAIIITTKSGSSQKQGIGVTFTSQFTAERAGFWPDFQTEYGTGADMGKDPFCQWSRSITGDTDRNTSKYSYGEPYGDGTKLRYQYEGYDWDTGVVYKTPWYYHDDWYNGIFQTGFTLDNTVAIEGSAGKGSTVRLSFKNSHNEWILPNTGFDKNTVALSLTQKMHKNIKLSLKLNYYTTDSENMPSSGYTNNAVMYQLAWARTCESPSIYADEYFKGRLNEYTYKNRSYTIASSSSNFYNPYYTLYEMTNSMDKDRLIGSIGLNITFTKKLKLDIKAAIDWMNEFRTQKKPFWTYNFPQGFYREQKNNVRDFNGDFMFHYDDEFVNGDLTFSAGLGGNVRDLNIRRDKLTLNRLDIEGIYNIYNYPGDLKPLIDNPRAEKHVDSIYGVLSLGWKDMIYLDVTGRNDWSSTLPREHRSFFYPSVSTSFMIDKLIKANENAPWINYLKVRASWANVGNDTDSYQLLEYWSSTNFPGGYRMPSTFPNYYLKPENVENWELGAEGKFFSNRVRFDVAVYQSNSTEQIFAVPYDWSTGARNYTQNIGCIRNRGIELSFGFVPIKKKNLRWDINLNMARNVTVLAEMYDGWDPSTPYESNYGTTIGNRIFVYNFVGQEMGQLWGQTVPKAPEGSYYLDESGNKVDCSGMMIIDETTGMPGTPDGTSFLGYISPDWTGGLSTILKIKDISISATFSGQIGGRTYSTTAAILGYQGKLKNTLEGRYAGLVLEGVCERVDADGNIIWVKNNTITEDVYKYYSNSKAYRYNFEEYTYDCSFLKFKELRLQYDLPNKLVNKLKILTGASVAAFATNLFCLTNYPMYDPEAGTSNGGTKLRGMETGNFPMTRTFGANVKLKF